MLIAQRKGTTYRLGFGVTTTTRKPRRPGRGQIATPEQGHSNVWKKSGDEPSIRSLVSTFHLATALELLRGYNLQCLSRCRSTEDVREGLYRQEENSDQYLHNDPPWCSDTASVGI
jgi:hypothetical protein